MNSQTHEHEPGTPVIVKMGGNQIGGTETGNPICISSPDMPFVDATGKRWQKAESTLEGRVCELKVSDGKLPDKLYPISSQTDVWTTVEVYNVADGTKLFELSEELVKGSIRLEISSNISFQVKDEESDQGWKESETEAEFLGKDIKIVFKQRDTTAQKDETILEYTFNSSVMSFTIYFPRQISN
ncbi:MAG TPA: hypothetical protein VF290_21555 [Pyrinomonadaceae bacterium]